MTLTAPLDAVLSDVRLVDAVTHVHELDELTWVVAGACMIEIAGARWRIDTATALWIPAGVAHRVVPRPDSLVFPLLFARSGGPDAVALVPRSPALDACARVLLQPGLSTPDAIASARDAAQLLVAHAGEARVPMPRDPRVRRLAQAILDAPAHTWDLEGLAERAHMSSRTVQRHFHRDTGMSFGTWRAEVRLAHARRILVRGGAVTAAARAAGYVSTSAFVAAFRRRHGVTPGTLAPRD